MTPSVFTIPYELHLFAGGFVAPAGWQPSSRRSPWAGPAPNQGSADWSTYLAYEYAFSRLAHLIGEPYRNEPSQVEVTLAQVFGLPEAPVNRGALSIIRGGFSGELCPVLNIRLVAYRDQRGQRLLDRSTEKEVRAMAEWLLEASGAEWVAGQQPRGRIQVVVRAPTVAGMA